MLMITLMETRTGRGDRRSTFTGCILTCVPLRRLTAFECRESCVRLRVGPLIPKRPHGPQSSVRQRHLAVNSDAQTTFLAVSTLLKAPAQSHGPRAQLTRPVE